MTETATLEPPAPVDPAVRAPYKGLRPYEEADQDLFFGRDAERNVLVDKILTNRLTLLFAATGVGKSSLLQAAVLPHLKDPRHENLEVVDYNDWVTPPLAGLKERTLEILKDRGHLADDAPLADLAALDLKDFLQFAALFGRPPLVVILDQFEEFFRYQRKTDEFEPFLRQLAAAVSDRDAPVAFVLSMREDFALELNALKPYLSTLLFENFYRLEKLHPESAEAAIVKPVELVDFRYEDELLDALSKDLAERDETERFVTPVAGWVDTVEPPYLQIVCSQLWEIEKDNPEKKLRFATYRDRGRADGLLKSYVHRVLGRFSAEEKRLASLAFSFLVTRHGTKMAYTVGELARTVGVDSEAMAGVLEKLHRARILRSQRRRDVLWYELYHDLFSGIIREWNDAYKARQRYRRAGIFAGIILVVGFLLFAAYDVTRNLVEHHYRLSLRRGGSETVDLYRGDAKSIDLLKLQRFENETQLRRSQIEPDKLFRTRPVSDVDVLSEDLIGYLPSEKRIRHYWEAGLVEKALDLAEKSISENDLQRSKEVISTLVSLGSRDIIDLLGRRLAEEGSYFVKTELVSALGTTDIPEATAALAHALQDDDATVRREALTSLAQHRHAKAHLETFRTLINDPSSEVRGIATMALGRLDGSEALNLLIERLNDTDSEVRQMAVWALAQFDSSKTLEVLLECLDHPDNELRKSVVRALVHLGNLEAVEPLIELLHDPNTEMRESAVGALRELGSSEAVEPLIEALKDPESDVRRSAIYALRELGGLEAVAPLIELLNDPDRNVRKSAIYALHELGGLEAVAPLIELLADPDSEVRGTAAYALGNFANLDAVAPVIELLHHQDSDVRANAAQLLGDLGSLEAVAPLIDCLNDPDSEVRQQAVWALRDLGSLEAVPGLIDRLNDRDDMVRESAARALGNLGSSETAALLIERLASRHGKVRQSAAHALGKVGSSEAMAPLIDCLNDPDSEVRGSAAGALGELGSLEAIAPLIGRLNDPDRQVSGIALFALARLGTSEAVAPLIEWLNDSDSELREVAVGTLGELGRSETVAPLIERLNDPVSEVRERAAEALGELGSCRAVAPLIEHLHDPESELSQEAAGALGGLGCLQAVVPLVTFHKNEGVSLLSPSGWALRKLVGFKTLGQLLGSEPMGALENDKYYWGSRQYLVIDRWRKAGSQAKEAVSAVFRHRSEIHEVRVFAAAALLALGSDEGRPFLRSAVYSQQVTARKDVVEAFTKLSVTQSIELLEPLLDDEVVSIKIQALKALRNVEASRALVFLHPRIEDSDLRIRRAAAETLYALAQPKSVPPIHAALDRNPTDVAVNLILLEALRNIGTSEAVDALLGAVRKNEEVLGLRAYKLLGELKAKTALPWLDKRLDQLTKATREWRKIRDDEPEDATKEEAEAWAAKLDDAKPQWHWAFELGFAIARIDPENRGVELLSHELADVRYGAWMGLGEVGTVDLLRRLDAERDENRTYPFRDAAYRAIDHMLRRLEGTATDDELQALRELLPEVRDRKAVCTRMEWTIRKLDKDSPLLDGHCEINWRQPTS